MELEESNKRPHSECVKDDGGDIEVLSVSKKPNISMPAVVEAKEPAVKSQLDLYKEALDYEESEVARRPASEDQQQFLATCGSVRDFMQQILALKAQKGEQSVEDVEANRVKIMMLMLNLRKLSRTQKVRVRLARDSVLDERQSVDGVTLQLQGLLYEVLHLHKEAQRCLLAHTADKEIELLPLEQFYQQAPQTVSRPEVTLDDPHQQRLARLHWELEQRRSQTTLSDQLTQEQEKVQREIEELETKLASLAPRISTILQATVPLQEALDLPLTAMRKQQEAAQLLPMPLYTLWMQTSAYSEAGDPLVCSMIRGDTEAATSLQVAQSDRPATAAAASSTAPAPVADNTPQDDSDNDAEDSSDVSSHKSRQRGSRTASSSNSKQQVKEPTPTAAPVPDPIKQMLTLHPLHVEVTVSVSEGSSVVVQFHYATELRLVTTRCLVLTKALQMLPGAVILTDVLNGSDFLDCLFPDDSGVLSPNPATVHQLQRYYASHGGRAPPPGGDAVVPAEIGRAYKWAQLLAGLAFPALLQGEPAAQTAQLAEMAQDLAADEKSVGEVSSERVHVTLNSIRRRLRSRLALQQHLLALQGATSTSCIPVSSDNVKELFPGKVCSELLSWRPIAWRDYAALISTAPLRDAGFATDRCLYFRAVYKRKHVDMVALVCVSPDYPQTVPMFSLEMKWGDQPCPYSHVQQLEAEVNVHWCELLSSGADRCQVLPLMLYRLAVCLDVYTEAASSRLTENDITVPSSDSLHFHKEKIFFRPARGPDRAFPLKYLPKLRVFAQR